MQTISLLQTDWITILVKDFHQVFLLLYNLTLLAKQLNVTLRLITFCANIHSMLDNKTIMVQSKT